MNAGFDRQTSEIDERYQRKIDDLEIALRTQAIQLSQITQLNSKLDTEVGRLKESIEEMQEQRDKDSELLKLLLEAANEHPDLVDKLIKRLV